MAKKKSKKMKKTLRRHSGQAKKTKRKTAKKARKAKPRKAKKVKKAKKATKKKVKETKRTKKKAGKKKAKKAKGKKTSTSRRPTGLRKPAKKPVTAKPALPAGRRNKAISNASAAVMQRLIGKVVHYYDRIGVAIIDLKEPLHVGDMVMLKKGDRIMPQRIDSIEIEHASVPAAKAGDIVGVKVDNAVHEGTVVLPG